MALLEKQHKMYSILRVHKKWENERMFGNNIAYRDRGGQVLPEYHLLNAPKQTIAYDEVPYALLQRYAKSFNNESEAFEPATYKMVYPESKLVRHILESNGVWPVNEDGNTWALMWSTNSLNNKPNVFNELYEY